MRYKTRDFDEDEWAEPAPRRALAAAWSVLLAILVGALIWAQFGPAEPLSPEARVALPPALQASAPQAQPERPAAPPPAVAAPSPAPEPAPAPPEPVQPSPPATPPVAAPAPPAPATPPPSAAAPRPLVHEANAPAWIRYGRPFDANDRRARIAVIVGRHLGMSSSRTDEAIKKLPEGVTLAFSPYADQLGHWVALARSKGHEVLLNVPMEPTDLAANDPGPHTLRTTLPPQQNKERLEWVLGRAGGYVGVASHMGSRFTAVPEAMKPVLAALKDRGLMFLDSRDTPRSVAPRLAAEIGVPRAMVDRQIDEELSPEAIDARLADAERIARETGSAVVMAQPFHMSIERLTAWLATLEEKGLVLAPLTAVANRQGDR